MSLAPKPFKRRGTGDLTEAISDILERRDAENLKKYIEESKKTLNYFDLVKVVSLFLCFF